MPRSPTQPVAREIPRWPATTAVLNADGSGRLTIDGRREDLPRGDLTASRELVKQRVTGLAEDLGRAVRLTSTDPDGEWQLAIGPDGSVRELAAQPAPLAAAPPVAAPALPEPPATTTVPFIGNGAPAPTPDPPLDVDPGPDLPTVALSRGATAPPLTRSQRKWAGTPAAPRRTSRPVAVAVALAVLVGLAATTALLATSGGPDTVVSERDATPRAISSGQDTAAADATDARRRGEERRAAAAAADRRAARRALQRRVSARQARERRAARRALQRRVAARQARERRAAARRTAAAQPPAPTRSRPRVTAPRPRVTAPPRPAAVTPPPPPPPPPARPRPCGEFDLC